MAASRSTSGILDESLIVKSLRAQYNNFILPALGGLRLFLNCFLALV
jgi:hypothetical protein